VDPNVKDILLVVLGAAGSLLGTALTLFFELRKDRAATKRERKNKDYERVAEYLANQSRLNSELIKYFGQIGKTSEANSEGFFESNVKPILDQINQSPISGLPPMLMTRDKNLADRLIPIIEGFKEIEVMIELGDNSTGASGSYLREHSAKLNELNILIKEIFTYIEDNVI